MLAALQSAWSLPDVRRKLLFTAAMLIIFRFVAHIPVPGVDPVRLAQFFQSNQLAGMLDLFSGGALTNFSVAAMGVYPYITASIIMQLLQPLIPQLEELAKEGEGGRARINVYTHILTIPLAALQGYGTGALLQSSGVLTDFGFGPGSNILGTIAILIAMTAGTVLLVWLGELITENGIGNGVSVLIFGGIVSQLPQIVARGLIGTGAIAAFVVFLVLGVGTVTAIVVIQEAQRRVPVQYAKRIRGSRLVGGQSTHIPLRVNSAGMIPLIFAMSIMLFPGTIASYFITGTGFVADAARFVYTIFQTSSPLYWILFFMLVVGFTFFYTMVIFQQQNLAETLQRHGGFIPGIRPGRPTAEYLNRVLFRITWLGAIFLGLVAVLPFIGQIFLGQTLTLSSTGLLIVVGVVLDTMKQLEAQMLMRNYEGFIK
ncbi:MAG: preprotein translocase subunit SecY [Chloroflexota bacterium]|nr:MAG: preprotein translocase subunit SecY [Chloroflexota bacterium]